MAKELTPEWFRKLVLVLSFCCTFIYGFWALGIYSFDERRYRFIPLIVPGYFLMFLLLELIARYRPKLRALGLPMLLFVILGLILARDSIEIWEGLGIPMLVVVAVLGFYSLITSYKVFKK